MSLYLQCGLLSSSLSSSLSLWGRPQGNNLTGKAYVGSWAQRSIHPHSLTALGSHKAEYHDGKWVCQRLLASWHPWSKEGAKGKPCLHREIPAYFLPPSLINWEFQLLPPMHLQADQVHNTVACKGHSCSHWSHTPLFLLCANFIRLSLSWGVGVSGSLPSGVDTGWVSVWAPSHWERMCFSICPNSLRKTLAFYTLKI